MKPLEIQKNKAKKFGLQHCLFAFLSGYLPSFQLVCLPDFLNICVNFSLCVLRADMQIILGFLLSWDLAKKFSVK